MKPRHCFLSLGLFLPVLVFANSGPASVIVLRGTVTLENGKALQLKDEVSPGNSVKTGPRSFAKLLFNDNSQINVGPDTTLKIEQTQAGSPSLVNLVGGQIRAKVTKDLLEKDSGSPEKLLIKTKSAAMGIRGTDFNVSFNQANNATSLVTFEGNVAMVKVVGEQSAANALAAGTNLQSVGPGQYSGTQPEQPQASVPVKISPGQFESLRRNDSYQGLDKSTAKSDGQASTVPPGVDAKLFASGSELAVAASVAKADAQSTGTAREPSPSRSGPPPEGFYDAKTGSYAPRAGGFIDLNSGRYVPPPPGSSFDSNTGVYVPPLAMGKFDPQSGMYVPPKGIELDPVKGFVTEQKSGTSAGAPAPAASTALTNLLNFAIRPELAGKQASFEKLFTPSASGAFAPPPNFQPPPPPGQAPPTTTAKLPPPPREPVDDPACPYCKADTIIPLPNTSNVNFQITVQ